jgi:hypothetical protein
MKPYFYINHNAIFKKPQNISELWNVSAGNIGNSYIGYCTIKLLEGEFKEVSGIQNIWNFNESKVDINEINNNFSKVILILQDHIRVDQSYYTPDYNKITNFLEKINIPFVILSLGSNGFTPNYDPDLISKLPKEKIRFLKCIASKTKEIGCRGLYTADNLNKLGIKNINPVGCHTFFLNKEKKILNNKTKIKNIACAGWIVKKNQLQENRFIKFNYFMQCMSESSDAVERYNKFHKLNKLKFGFFKKRRFYLPYNIQEWEELIAKNDFSISSRVHGSIMALNNNVPALLINRDLRAREMSELFSIPLMREFDSRNFDAWKIYSELDFTEMNAKFPELYNNFLQFLKNNDLCLKQQ